MNTRNNTVNSILNIFKTAANLIFPLIVLSYVSRVIGPEFIGKINFYNSFINYFVLIATLGVTTYATRECGKVANDNKELSKTASEIFSINMCSTCLAYVLLFFAIFISKDIQQDIILVLWSSITIISNCIGVEWFNNAIGDFKSQTIRTLIFKPACILVILLFVKSAKDYVRYAAIMASFTFLSMITNYVWNNLRHTKISLQICADARKHIKPILTLWGLVLAESIFFNIDITLLKIFKGDSTVGLYSTAVNLTYTFGQILLSIVWVFIPQISLMYKENNFSRLNEVLRNIRHFFSIVGIPCLVGIFMMAEEILLLISGENYVSAAPYMRVAAIAFAVCIKGGAFWGSNILLPLGEDKFLTIQMIIVTIMNIILDLLFIPILGGVGAAIATVISYLVIATGSMIRVRKKWPLIKINIAKKTFINEAGVVVGLVVICSAIKYLVEPMLIRLFLAIGVSLIFYLAFLFITKDEIVVLILELIEKRKHPADEKDC